MWISVLLAVKVYRHSNILAFLGHPVRRSAGPRQYLEMPLMTYFTTIQVLVSSNARSSPSMANVSSDIILRSSIRVRAI